MPGKEPSAGGVQSGEVGGRLQGDEAVQNVPTSPNGVYERMSSQFIQHQRTEVDEGEGVHNVIVIQWQELLALWAMLYPVSYYTARERLQED